MKELRPEGGLGGSRARSTCQSVAASSALPRAPLSEQRAAPRQALRPPPFITSRNAQVFPYPLDNFQKKSLEVFLSGRSVVVCAPTGAGKTAIAEAAAAAVLARGQRVIYTTPLKVQQAACCADGSVDRIECTRGGAGATHVVAAGAASVLPVVVAGAEQPEAV